MAFFISGKEMLYGTQVNKRSRVFLHDYVVVSDDTYSIAQALPYSAWLANSGFCIWNIVEFRPFIGYLGILMFELPLIV